MSGYLESALAGCSIKGLLDSSGGGRPFMPPVGEYICAMCGGCVAAMEDAAVVNKVGLGCEPATALLPEKRTCRYGYDGTAGGASIDASDVLYVIDTSALTEFECQSCPCHLSSKTSTFQHVSTLQCTDSGKLQNSPHITVHLRTIG